MLFATSSADGGLGAFQQAAFAGVQRSTSTLLSRGQLSCGRSSQWLNGASHVFAEHVANGGHEGCVHWICIALRASVKLTHSASSSALFCRQSISTPVKQVALHAHLSTVLCSLSGSVSVHSLVVSAFAEGAAAVGVSVGRHVLVDEGTHIACALSSSVVNSQVSVTFVAVQFHFFASIYEWSPEYINNTPPLTR